MLSKCFRASSETEKPPPISKTKFPTIRLTNEAENLFWVRRSTWIKNTITYITIPNCIGVERVTFFQKRPKTSCCICKVKNTRRSRKTGTWKTTRHGIICRRIPSCRIMRVRQKNGCQLKVITWSLSTRQICFRFASWKIFYGIFVI